MLDDDDDDDEEDGEVDDDGRQKVMLAEGSITLEQVRYWSPFLCCLSFADRILKTRFCRLVVSRCRAHGEAPGRDTVCLASSLLCSNPPVFCPSSESIFLSSSTYLGILRSHHTNLFLPFPFFGYT